ncbi:MAG: basic amino acid ABC transporter substrate-binding protein [Chloroflexi bacterium]|nr:basic amino acid ABC transporter substrate-binding protein [Chloroflexota bacterium]MBU1751015.1 basic amino acid ABC transporter substrate-binding protein [Chloroflexota bacterium]
MFSAKRLYPILAVAVIAVTVLAAQCPSSTPPTPTTVPATAMPTTPPPLKITVATDATWPPFEYVDESTKEIVGFDIDLLKAVAKEANLELEFTNVGWDPLLAGMAAGQYDAAISAMTITEERRKQFDFSNPYYDAGQLIVVRADQTGIEKPADLAGHVCGAQIGTTGAMEIQKVEGATLKTYDTIDLAYMDLINGQVDAVIADNPLAVGYVNLHKGKIMGVGQPFTEEQYGIAVRQGAPEILDRINKGLKIVLDRGIIKDLEAKWLAEPIE